MIPSAVTELEAHVLQMLARDKLVLEVGSLLGYSTVKLAQVATRVVAIDPHEGYPAANPRPTFATFVENLKAHGVRDKVTPMVGTHDDVFPHLATRQFDVAFIDCTGEYDLTLDVIRKVQPLLRHFAYLCVHDCGHPDWPGALEAVETFASWPRAGYKLVDRMAVFEGVWSGW